MITSELKFRRAAKNIARVPVEDGNPSEDLAGGKFAVVLDSDDRTQWEKFRTLAGEFKVSDANFAIMTLIDTKAEDSQVVALCSADIDWRGRIRNERVLDFFRNKYEVLLVFTSEISPLMRFVVQATRAELKIGREENSSSLYDLSISTRSVEVDLFLEEVRKYLGIIKYRK